VKRKTREHADELGMSPQHNSLWRPNPGQPELTLPLPQEAWRQLARIAKGNNHLPQKRRHQPAAVGSLTYSLWAHERAPYPPSWSRQLTPRALRALANLLHHYLDTAPTLPWSDTHRAWVEATETQNLVISATRATLEPPTSDLTTLALAEAAYLDPTLPKEHRTPALDYLNGHNEKSQARLDQHDPPTFYATVVAPALDAWNERTTALLNPDNPTRQALETGLPRALSDTPSRALQ
jgi:hypothetical protein